jgi:hypothetical protein
MSTSAAITSSARTNSTISVTNHTIASAAATTLPTIASLT